MKNRRFDLIVVGGGASGLMAAITAARKNVRVLILDHHTAPAKKLLATGNGKCNFTNIMQGSSCYRCDDPAFVLQTLEQFDAARTIAFFEELGVLARQRQGYYYPRSNQASAIRNALLAEAERLKIQIINEIGIRLIQREADGFLLNTKDGDYVSKACILAAGGKASPKTGSDGSGYLYAQKLGHSIVSPLPALVPLVAEASWLKETAGVRCDASVTLFVDQKPVASDSGEIQMTDYGISGIPVFQVSRYASAALAQKKRVEAKLDFLPEREKDALISFLAQRLAVSGMQQNWESLLSGFVNQKISAMICSRLKLPESPVVLQPAKTVQRQMQQISNMLKGTCLTITKTKSFEQAQVTCGGISIREIHAGTMESKRVPGLYFAGEIIDVDGICGGYNLQWAWASGFAAGTHAADQIKNREHTKRT